MDWIDSDMPFEGTVRQATLGFLADRSAPTCRPDEPVASVRERVADRQAGVVNETGVLLGLLPPHAGGSPRVEEVMIEGPSTYRPHVTAAEVLPQAERRNMDEVIVTTLEGRLVGFVPIAVVRRCAALPG